jgi:hypothetical protein
MKSLKIPRGAIRIRISKKAAPEVMHIWRPIELLGTMVKFKQMA